MTDTDIVWQERVDALKTEIAGYKSQIHRESADSSIMMAMLQHFIARAIERGDHNTIRDAVEFAYDDTGIPYEDIAEIVDRLGICDSGEYCQREYLVSVTVPVTVSVQVTAYNEDDAENKARDEVDNCICDYQMEYDVYYDADYYVEEV